MRKKPRTPEQQSPRDRICRAVALAFEAADRNDIETVKHWLQQASQDGYVMTERTRKQLEYRLDQQLDPS